MSTHEFNAYCDSQEWTEQDDTLLMIEQERDFAEMEIERESMLKRQGAKEALVSLESFLLYCGANDKTPSHYLTGLKWAVDSIHDRIKDLEVTGKREGGAA